MTQHLDAKQLLATYLSGSNVAAASIGLQLGGHALTLAQPYFALREALGVTGYMSREEAVERIETAFAARENITLTERVRVLEEALRQAAWELTDKGHDREAAAARAALTNEKESQL